MFEFKWKDEKEWRSLDNLSGYKSRINRQDIFRTLNLKWEEHCLECAEPICYNSCVVYTPRVDGKCRRFKYGIYPNNKFRGHYDFGADITFRKWAKIEADLNVSNIVNSSFNLGKIINKDLCHNPSSLAEYSENGRQIHPDIFDEFVIECWSEDQKSFNMVVEYFVEVNQFRETKFKHNVSIVHGYNFFRIPFVNFNLLELTGYLYLSPDDSSTERRIVFTWLDFVKYRQEYNTNVRQSISTMPKIKCVAWDLDNTLWNGVYIEDDDILPKQEAVQLVEWLDNRGILQTIVSKNDKDAVWKKLMDLNLDKFFVGSEINWEPKSKNLCKIAKTLNIGLDTIAVIDDSLFEREEIKTGCPEVRTYSDADIERIYDLDEFNVIISGSSKDRRIQYQTESRRNSIREGFGGSYEEFLHECKIEVNVFVPKGREEVERCFELIQRSNQLNLSTVRYSREEFLDLLSMSNVISLALRCKDRFGDYGIIGFASMKIDNNNVLLENFVLSCRVAQKTIEHSVLSVLGMKLFKLGYDYLLASLVKTTKNGPLIKVFYDLPFTIESVNECRELLSLNLSGIIEENHILVTVELDDSVEDALIIANGKNQDIN